MTTLKQVQQALLDRGYSVGAGGADGLIGPSTLGAMLRALDAIPRQPAENINIIPPKSSKYRVVPEVWMPFCHMTGIVFHWTAGAAKASSLDKSHYHILIEGTSELVRGKPSIDLNAAPVKQGYAAHTLNANGGRIGVSLCGMAGAKESPFDAGKSPINERQWDKLSYVLADLCQRYAIPVTRGTVLSHAEVQQTLKITQRGKWDVARLPWNKSAVDAIKIGDEMRSRVTALLK